MPNAQNLPAGSVVATDKIAVFRLMDGIGAVWQSTNNRRYTDADIDRLLSNGATVLRVGLPGATD